MYDPDYDPDELRRQLRQVHERVKNVAHIPRRSDLSAGDFPQETVQLEFEDGSSARFNHAFSVSESRWYVVVYTEHCGYHSFPKASITNITSTPLNAR